MLDPTETIVAVGSPAGGGPLGLVRLSGDAAFAVVLNRFQSEDATQLVDVSRPTRISGQLAVESLGRPLSVSLNLCPGSRTYTGQPLVEIQTIGSPPILAAVLATCLDRGARLAEPGEFTLRAFLAGRIDLTQAEAVLGVIDAANSEQLDVALGQLAGGLARPLTRLRDDLADTLAHLEANLDFADEADVDPLGRAQLAATLQRHADEVAHLAARLSGRSRGTGRPRVVLVGPPNAGKSLLFNALIGRDASIVAAVAGTTRDYLEAECDCDGIMVDLVDTAGTETTRAEIEAQAQAVRRDQTRVADLVLVCEPIRSEAATIIPLSIPGSQLHVGTKYDLISDSTRPSSGQIITSGSTGEGIKTLRSAIARSIRDQSREGMAASLAATVARSGEGMAAASRSLRSAAAAILEDGGDELIAIDLRQALDDLGRIVGAVVTDDLLDRIFRRFCIGK